MKLNIFSDLRKPGLVPGKSLSLAQNYVFCFGETLIYKNFFIINITVHEVSQFGQSMS